ncbi:MAG: DNA polymerase sliding clamp [Thermoplasmata archaeon]
MELKMKIKDLRDVVNMLLTLVTEAKFEFTEKGLNVKCVDSAHVAMIVVNLGKEAFIEYDFEEEMSIGIDLDKIKDFLKLAAPEDIVSLKLDDRKITFSVRNLTRSMTTIDPSNITSPKIPSLGLPAKATVSSSQFAEGLRAGEAVSDNITLYLTPNELEIYTSSEEDTSKMVIPKDLLKDLQCQEEVKSIYPIDYLLKFIRAVDFSENVTINLGKDYPVKIEFTFKDNKGDGLFLLAPRIEGD